MPRKPANHREGWTEKEVRRLEKLVDSNTPTRLIARELGRTTGAVYQKASEEGISLKPTNQPPYGPRKKR